MLNLLVRQYGQQESPHALMLTSILTVAGFPSRTSGNLYSGACQVGICYLACWERLPALQSLGRIH